MSAEVDTHMMKNTEWGAVAYLSQSEYGANEEIWNNSYNGYRTGCGGSSVSAYNESTCYEYTTTNGQKASTTHNIYGVYDMSGGAMEYVAAYVDNGHSNLTTYGQSIINADIKYKDVYTVGSSDSTANNYEANKNKYGDAVYETSSSYESFNSWYGDYSYAVVPATVWFRRGGHYDLARLRARLASAAALAMRTRTTASGRWLRLSPLLRRREFKAQKQSFCGVCRAFAPTVSEGPQYTRRRE